MMPPAPESPAPQSPAPGSGSGSGAGSGTPMRYLSIGAALCVVAGAFAYVGGWFSPSRLTQSRMMEALQGAGGVHPGFRSNHAKGMCFSGVFESRGDAVPWSKASVFAPGRVAVTGRFALAGGMPFQADKTATVRSMALRFVAADGGEWRTGMNNIPVFIVNSAAAFQEQLVASRLDPRSGKADPAAMQAFLARHPEAARAITLIKAQPATAGFADSTYHSLDAFRFVNAAGQSVPVRWAAVPMQEAVVQANSPDDDAAQGKESNRLFDDLIAQLRKGRLRWRLMITLGEPGDPTADATLPWPDTRRRVEAGILAIEQASSEDGGACRDINFDPLVLPTGIEPSDDPLLSARSAVYARSHTLRAGERAVKPPSAVTPQETQGGVAP